ncbi:MAG: NifU family protein [Mycolicibacterium sp.]|uniref:NifU family protein n=1 Tax=Mycolicibacterium sp. TaxID=2320850 RepID=UPI003D10ABFA
MSIPMPGLQLHAETTEDPRLIKWLTGTRLLSAASPQVRGLLDDGVLERIDAAPGEVLTLLAEGRSWAAEGPRVRSVLFAALSADQPVLSDAELLAQISEVLQREVAPVADSHGGSVTARSVRDGILTVEFGGACHGCSASGKTLSDLVSRSVRMHYPQIVEVRAASTRRTWLTLSPGRSGRPATNF